MQTQFLTASDRPLEDIDLVTYAGQDPKRRKYVPGYEYYMNTLPFLHEGDRFLDAKIDYSRAIMNNLAAALRTKDWLRQDAPGKGGFDRSILAIEKPYFTYLGLKEGKELIVARWGDGFASPVHGHAPGLLHEELLFGKILVNTYRQVAPDSEVVRLLRTDIFEGDTNIVSTYAVAAPGNQFKRHAWIHNFVSIGTSASLHYVPEHTRDGRDNQFRVEYFRVPDQLEVERISGEQAMYLRKGDVVLVRSENVPDYGDHYIVVTGQPVLKKHGLRPQEVAIAAPNAGKMLDHYSTHDNGLVLLKLHEDARQEFLRFHGITIVNGEVVLPATH